MSALAVQSMLPWLEQHPRGQIVLDEFRGLGARQADKASQYCSIKKKTPLDAVGTGLAPVRTAREKYVWTRSVCVCSHFSDRGKPCPYENSS